MSALNEALLDTNSRQVLDLLDELRQIAGSEIIIPQIAVVGDQSSGKSSVLEALSGIPFPRGLGLVTKCPICISMHKTPIGTKWIATATTSLNNNEEPINISSPEELAQIINSFSDQLSKSSTNGFSRETINVHVDSPDVTDLNIVDLPGIIRTTTAGQSTAIIQEVDSLIESFIIQSRTIILAVIPANQDIATIDVLERAQKYDPKGKRTIGVLTKCDLVDEGGESQVINVVNNLSKPLSLGYIMVKNRNQQELKENMSPSSARTNEIKYFTEHSEWKKLDRSCLGIDTLSTRLTKVLVSQAQSQLPLMRSELQSKLDSILADMSTLGEEGPLDETDQRRLLLKLCSRFGQTLRQITIGDYRDEVAQSSPDLRVKFTIDEIIKDLKNNLSKSVPDFGDEEYSQKLIQELTEMRGRELPGFMSARLLITSASADFEPWRIECENAISKITEVYARTSSVLVSKIAGQFPKLCSRVMELVESSCIHQSSEMMRRIEELFDGGGANGYINDEEFQESINSIRFRRFDNAVEACKQSAIETRPGKMTKDELKQHVKEMLGHMYMQFHSVGYGPSVHVDDAKEALKSYWHTSRNRLNDNVASIVDLQLLKGASELIEQDLISLAQQWSCTDEMADILSERPESFYQRQVLKKKEEKVRAAIDKIKNFRIY